ncbi:hypothetical protein ACQKOE_16255 [Novosphingobium sp. NPDC080210]|uniref:hypothetical protein n=1 Tax=Novosphingobium sp. NPDC080210 TaxID=3390596 RepID=UPI003D073BCD
MSEVRNNAVWMVRVAAAAFAVAASQPAMAQASQEQTAYYGGYNGNPTMAVLTIPVKASVNTRCGFQQTFTKPVDAGEIDRNSWTDDTPFVPECTTPWRIAISSQNGGLLNDTATGLAEGYLNKAPYTVSLLVKNDEADVDVSCAAADLSSSAGAACSFKGTASATEGLRIARSYQLTGSRIRVSAPAYTGPGVLVAGTYTDTLTVTVSPTT